MNPAYMIMTMALSAILGAVAERQFHWWTKIENTLLVNIIKKN